MAGRGIVTRGGPTVRAIRNGVAATVRHWLEGLPGPQSAPRIGLALGGGFARGIAHIGVLRVLEREGIPVSYLAGVSAGSMVAAAYASGMPLSEIERVARSMRLKDVASWTLSRMGLAHSERMSAFLRRMLREQKIEEMRIPLAVVATDLASGEAAVLRSGDVISAVRASCAYPGLFLPVRRDGRWLVDGMVGMDVPAAPLRDSGATHVIAVAMPPRATMLEPGNMLSVVARSFQIFCRRTESQWRRFASLVIQPEVSHIGWDAFDRASDLIAAGECAAEAALPAIRAWFPAREPRTRQDSSWQPAAAATQP